MTSFEKYTAYQINHIQTLNQTFRNELAALSSMELSQRDAHRALCILEEITSSCMHDGIFAIAYISGNEGIYLRNIIKHKIPLGEESLKHLNDASLMTQEVLRHYETGHKLQKLDRMNTMLGTFKKGIQNTALKHGNRFSVNCD